ncbi:Uncharacterised protein [Burkholderia pseudomallei]|nr:amino acid ABC transporter, permease/ATP-binding, His/Glu/Gln/Arg/opine family domain protein [Burkholderia pseudomallei TSV 48]KGC35373.1 amino acid ABC transporter, permease/ATP-binding, His/Glu/Gln/Arg/opine family domain protein [Burkholderia pseudomallei]KGD33937.1 amino acid ABC transporter, permease/ATP-binding, His/Glu/Gln/Arg/opine family domain protein [Burkholderia pseudomallei]KGD49126.1 amino acid ABC transporter, permease/ATP-binding, His/Glu/Gln/Arg/opine family domain protein 
MSGIERNSQMNAHAHATSNGERDTRASASGTPSAKPNSAPSAVSSSVRASPESTGSDRNHSAKTGQPHCGLPSTEFSTSAISTAASTVPAVRARWRAGTILKRGASARAAGRPEVGGAPPTA